MERVAVRRVSRPKKQATSALFPEDKTSAGRAKKDSSPPATGLPDGLDPEDFEMDQDGHPRQLVGSWVRDKHARLERYVHISSHARAKWIKPNKPGPTYIDLFAGPGRCRIRESADILPGSALVAWNKAQQSKSAFTRVLVGDVHPAICAAVDARLKAVGAPVSTLRGPAVRSVDLVLSQVDPRALHLALLDPFDLVSLPFDVVRKLASLQHIDILIHFSTQDLIRNLRLYIERQPSALDVFAPGWREHVDVERPDHYVRAKIFHYWRDLLRTIGMNTTEAAVLVSGPTGQPLYWLAFAARHPLALRFWEQIRDLKPDPQRGILAAQ